MGERKRIPTTVWILAAGGAIAGTSEFIPAGILPEVASEFAVPVPTAGLIVSIFALGMIVGGICSMILPARLPRKKILVFTLVTIFLGHALGAGAAEFPILLATRFFSAVAIGIYWATAGEYIVAVAPSAVRVRALGCLVSSMLIATVLGVPLGTMLGEKLSWRAEFYVLAGLSLVVAVILRRALMKHEDLKPPTSAKLTARLRLIGNKGLLRAYLLVVLYQAAVMCLLTYIKPLLVSGIRLPISSVPWALALFGIGGIVGLRLSGRFADKQPRRVLMIALFGIVCAPVALVLSSSFGVIFAVIAVFGYGLSAFMAAPSLNAAAFRHCDNDLAMASGGNTVAFNFGNIVGPSVGGLAVAKCGIESTAVVALGVALLAFLVAALPTYKAGVKYAGLS
ncbi:MFS transporter [Mycobacteroides abscessus]|uniref:MFS transporter n=1 Tax=Mycobacteroides abscessus TaxID=36809 RepID=UPI001314355C|nr:MFS transporter [Mycobacteroides abscessus]